MNVNWCNANKFEEADCNYVNIIIIFFIFLSCPKRVILLKTTTF